MAYLDFIKPILVADLIKKVTDWRNAYLFELALRKVCMDISEKFKGKVVNKKLLDALKEGVKTLLPDGVQAWETTNYTGRGERQIQVKPNRQPQNTTHELGFTFVVCYDLSTSRLDWDKTEAENKTRTEYAQKMANECHYLLTEDGQDDCLKPWVQKWEKAMTALKEVNAKGKEFSVLQYEFDLSRYK